MTLAAWMARAIVLGVLLCLAAHVLERHVDRARRWIWGTALLASAAVPMLAAMPAVWPEWLRWRVRLTPLAGFGSGGAERSVARGITGTAGDVLLLLWALLSLVCAARYLNGWLRLGQLSRGTRVRWRVVSWS